MDGNLCKARKLSYQSLHPGERKQNVRLTLSIFDEITIAASRCYYHTLGASICTLGLQVMLMGGLFAEELLVSDKPITKRSSRTFFSVSFYERPLISCKLERSVYCRKKLWNVGHCSSWVIFTGCIKKLIPQKVTTWMLLFENWTWKNLG